jgi:hypothetical protein
MAENRICSVAFVEVSQIDFQQNLWKELWNAWKRSFIALYKLEFTMDEYGWNLEFP